MVHLRHLRVKKGSSLPRSRTTSAPSASTVDLWSTGCARAACSRAGWTRRRRQTAFARRSRTRTSSATTFIVSATEDPAGWQNDPAILSGHVSCRRMLTGGHRTIGASATSMSLRVCGRLCDIDRVLVTCGVRKPFADCAVAHQLDTPVGRASGFKGYRPSGHDGLARPCAARLKASPHGQLLKAGRAFDH